MRHIELIAATALSLFCAIASNNGFAQVNGAGSSLARDLMGRWAQAYGGAVGGVTYESVGSSRGVEHAKKGEVDFGVTDVPLTVTALKQSSLRQLPLAATAVVMAVNLPEIAGQPLRLTGDVLANIYTGKVQTWNHSMIAALNPGLKLPNRPIVPLWRSDGSGQSYVFSTYMSRSNSAWRRSTGQSQVLSGLSGRGVVGGAAMLSNLKATPGAIGYEGFGAARNAGLTMVSLRNASEQFVSPTAESITEAISKARWAFDNGENTADLDASPGVATYPMAAVIYALVPRGDAATRNNSLVFFADTVQRGDAAVSAAGFLPLPASAKTVVAAMAKG
jgi:phosphate transport system substrate-binding protein